MIHIYIHTYTHNKKRFKILIQNAKKTITSVQFGKHKEHKPFICVIHKLTCNKIFSVFIYSSLQSLFDLLFYCCLYLLFFQGN
uniref:Uncharacterized protein n=1 Tax=Octopus bimaculoides TaxID=37653 RepID=A0A0L8ICT1_OCTBM